MKKIGKYIVCGLLGRGGMSVVYKARLPVANRIVALKLLFPHPNLVSLLGGEAVRERFLSEVARMASLRSPHVVEILDFDYDGENPFFTMEYYYLDLGRIIGETYRADLPSRILSLDKTLHYSRQILEGLARLSRAGIVHRDIKPGNLLVSDEDRIKICDFGFSRLRGERLRRSPQLVVGSPFYAAPEQERDPDRVDQRADIYSVGVIVHRMLTGLLAEEGIRRPSQYHPDADSAWDGFVRKALAPEPENRFETAGAMLAALEGLGSAWAAKKETFCRGESGGLLPDGPGGRGANKLRSAPIKVGAKEAPAAFGCDRLMRPERWRESDFSLRAGGGTVLDAGSGLVWQQSGSEDPVPWDRAHHYIQGLNRLRFGGCSRWRLPSAEELLSLLRPPRWEKRDCMSPVFDGKRKLLWSCDRCTYVSGWYADLELGFAGFADFTCHFYAKAVTEAENILDGILENILENIP